MKRTDLRTHAHSHNDTAAADSTSGCKAAAATNELFPDNPAAAAISTVSPQYYEHFCSDSNSIDGLIRHFVLIILSLCWDCLYYTKHSTDQYHETQGCWVLHRAAGTLITYFIKQSTSAHLELHVEHIFLYCHLFSLLRGRNTLKWHFHLLKMIISSASQETGFPVFWKKIPDKL